MKLGISTRLFLLTGIAAGALLLGGCEADCYEMTDGGAVGANIQKWRLEDRAASESLKPEVTSWWQKEKAKWPVFKKKCVDSAQCYDHSIAAEAESAIE